MNAKGNSAFTRSAAPMRAARSDEAKPAIIVTISSTSDVRTGWPAASIASATLPASGGPGAAKSSSSSSACTIEPRTMPGMPMPSTRRASMPVS
ncbi:MAG: hypothetical protein WKF40_01845 [Thermoleophilaceae bacterium]